jgi:hypothetical protein
MLKSKTYSSIILNLIISILYFKQLFIPGAEVAFLDTKAILLTPFVLFHGLLGFIAYSTIQDKDFFSFKKLKFLEIVPVSMFTIIMLTFILSPLVFLEYKNGYKFALPFLITFLEPIKIKYVFKQDDTVLLQKNFMLFIISLTLIFVSSLLPKFNALENSLTLYMGGFYFIFLSYFDYYFYKRNKT